jgi:D-ribulokinase
MNCYLGIDFGTSGARAIAINQRLEVEAEISQRFDTTRPGRRLAKSLI